jgi:hypothetical protein
VRYFLFTAMLCVPLATAAPQSQSSQPPTSFTVPTPAEQIALAVLPAPLSLRDGATVMGYNRQGQLVRLRAGNNGIICLAADPRETRFHTSCYHSALEPFMARGRAIRARHGSNREILDSIRLADIRAGRLRMPQRSVLYQIFAERDSVDARTARVRSPSYLHVVYLPGATSESTGLTTDALRGTPWLMYPGTPWAHIMIVP